MHDGISGPRVILPSCKNILFLYTLAQFKVHVRGPQVVSLQSMHDPSHWLRIYKNDLNAKVCIYLA